MQTRLKPKATACAWLALATLAALAGCANLFPPATFPGAKGAPTPAAPPSPAPANSLERTAASLDEAASRADPADRPGLQLQAARAWLRADRPSEAARALHGITGTL